MIWYITGGERSGKSSYAQQLALQHSSSPIYLATSRRWDEDFNKRIQLHVHSRDERWTTIEEEKAISRIVFEGKVVVFDCVTLWLTNFYTDTQYNLQESLRLAKEEFDKITFNEGLLIIISNELGMGTHAETAIGRKFVELQGWMNQYIAARADKATMMVSGLPLQLK
jgi:adenosylcobinamide kinase/adenosylcobinamide-phosphate guanylyltransferase